MKRYLLAQEITHKDKIGYATIFAHNSSEAIRVYSRLSGINVLNNICIICVL